MTKPLTKKVADTIRDFGSENELDAALLEALKLAEKFDNIKPTEYILPLNALAGIPVLQKMEDHNNIDCVYSHPL